ncbi:hypothetical protein PG994_015150 [Apiospora phragmitis]|uniref:Uncharacterized protein n=1 Tax=Apiospora phragmitis TaxID=2905665 RepID=A0ABR1SVM8_9PEZI
MSIDPRPRSSFYSDEFQLDDLLHRLSEQTWEQEVFTLQLLLQENEELSRELSGLQRRWKLVYKAMAVSAETASQMNIMIKRFQELLAKEQNKWKANFTAF